MKELGPWLVHAPADQAYVQKRIQSHIAALPPTMRLGMGLPPAANIAHNRFAYFVPEDMWDSAPGSRGLVRWNGVSISASYQTRIPYGGLVPPMLHAYLMTQRVCRIPLVIENRSCWLPGTPTHNPSFDFSRLTGRWRQLIEKAGYLPVGESSDGAMLVCLDRRSVPRGQDSGIYLFNCESLFRLEPELFSAANGHDIVKPLGRLAFPSFAALLDNLSVDGMRSEPIPDVEQNAVINLPQPFDYGSFLHPEPASDQEFPTQYAQEISPASLRDHLERIQGKLECLRRADPAFLIWGAESHQYQMKPRLLPEERQEFELTERCALPEAYAQFLMHIGNGGVGPWRWMRRVEYSGARWASFWGLTDGTDPDRLGRPFPHRRLWNPDCLSLSDDEREKYHHHGHLDGTIAIGEHPDEQMRMVMLLIVVNGPERGHIWADHRSRGCGIMPVCRRGPYSFLAWYEGGLDAGLGSIKKRYGDYYQSLAAVD